VKRPRGAGTAHLVPSCGTRVPRLDDRPQPLGVDAAGLLARSTGIMRRAAGALSKASIGARRPFQATISKSPFALTSASISFAVKRRWRARSTTWPLSLAVDQSMVTVTSSIWVTGSNASPAWPQRIVTLKPSASDVQCVLFEAPTPNASRGYDISIT